MMNPEYTGAHERNPVVCWTKIILPVALSLMSVIPATSQWLNYPSPGIPRTSDGKPDLAAPAPRTADERVDLSGLWRPNAGGYQINATADLLPGEIRPWAAAVTKQHVDNLSRENPVAFCLPSGPTMRAMTSMVKIVQTPSLIVMLYESRVHDREIFMDGRKLPEDPNPTWMGYSVGRWEGDTLVVESAGFNDKTWLDATHPHTEALRVTERFTRRDFGHMQLQLTIDDPLAYTRPFVVPVDLEFVADTELLEDVCENERDAVRSMNAKLSSVTLPTSVLSTFTGIYEVITGAPDRIPRFPSGSVIVVTLVDDQVRLQRPGDKIGLPLAPISDTRFVLIGGGADIQFVKDATGTVTQLIFQSVEGESQAIRKSK